MDEFNKEQLQPNKTSTKEYVYIGSTEPIKEYSSYKKAKTTAKVTSIVIAFIGASLVLGSVLSFTLFKDKITTEVEQFVVTPGIYSIGYDIVIKKTESKNLKLKLHSLYIDKSINLEKGETIGSFTELKPGTVYDISIQESNVVVLTKRITTYTEGA